jgi:hypothetical protein
MDHMHLDAGVPSRYGNIYEDLAESCESSLCHFVDEKAGSLQPNRPSGCTLGGDVHLRNGQLERPVEAAIQRLVSSKHCADFTKVRQQDSRSSSRKQESSNQLL